MARIIKAEAMQNCDSLRGTVLNLTDLAAEARSVVLEARKEAARILADTKSEAEEVLRQGGERGYAEGFARGQNDGYADGEQRSRSDVGSKLAAEADELISLARKVIDELLASRADLLHQCRCEMLDFALDLSEKIVGRVAATDIEAAKANLAKVFEQANCAGRITIKVNPAQLSRLGECCPSLVEAFGLANEVRLVGDESVGPGGVILLSRHGRIDATVETQLANVAEAMLGEADASRGAGAYVSQVPNAQSGVIREGV